jgi:prepilin-type N-terminal cleavage/methylation domain-containing protein/prepilin-type processing-associated H-X9-DG protein
VANKASRSGAWQKVKTARLPVSLVPARRRHTSNPGFTLVELLVVIAIIALLLAVLMPALRKARLQGQAIVCAAQMRQYGLAVVQYEVDNKDQFPPYCHITAYNNPPATETVWVNLLAPFFGGEQLLPNDTPAVKRQKSDKNMAAKFRRCATRKAWVGVHYGGNASGNNVAPFIITDSSWPAFKGSSIRHPATWIAFMDTTNGWGMYSPKRWPFDYDYDKDGIKDSNRAAAMNVYWYNDAAPKAHFDSSNIVLCDGHVERMTYRQFVNPKNNLWNP